MRSVKSSIPSLAVILVTGILWLCASQAYVVRAQSRPKEQEVLVIGRISHETLTDIPPTEVKFESGKLEFVVLTTDGGGEYKLLVPPGECAVTVRGKGVGWLDIKGVKVFVGMPALNFHLNWSCDDCDMQDHYGPTLPLEDLSPWMRSLGIEKKTTTKRANGTSNSSRKKKPIRQRA